MHIGTNSTNQHNNHDDHQAINIDEIDRHRLAAIYTKVSRQPKILSKSVGRGTCSIFKAPKSFNDVNGKLYQPKIVSIGPFHHGLTHVEMMEEYKYQYLGQLLTRTHLDLIDLFKAIKLYENDIRECYSEVIHFESQELLEMMVVDGCFILEFFRKVTKLVQFEVDDPVASMSWIFPALLRDLHLLENQMPFFVLQCLFDLTNDDQFNGGEGEERGCISLATLCLDFFNYAIQRPVDIILKYKDVKPKHLLDLLRTSFITKDLDLKHSPRKSSAPSHVILSVSKLRQAGIQFQPGEAETFLAVKFKRGIIQMPTVTFDDFMTSLFANCVAFEQCHKGCSTYFTTYATFVDCLVNTASDVEYLCDKNIIENYYGTDAEIATFINNLGKETAFDLDLCYMARLFDDVNTYYKNNWHVQWASFKYTYFKTPWSFASAVAAFVLLVLTVMQTVFTVLPYYRPKS